MRLSGCDDCRMRCVAELLVVVAVVRVYVRVQMIFCLKLVRCKHLDSYAYMYMCMYIHAYMCAFTNMHIYM